MLIKCHAGCPTQDVLAALRLDWPDLFPEGRSKAEIVVCYDYTDEHGHPLYQAVRYFPKGFKRRRPDGNGGWVWSLKGVDQVLYQWPRVLAAVEAGEVVYVVEGEKDVHAIERVGATATTVLGGVNGKWLPDFSRLLAKTRVVVVADDDDPGRQRARRIGALIAEHGGQVELVAPAAGKDAADHLAAGKALAELRPLDRAGQVDVDGAALLEEVYGTLERFVVFPSGQAAVAVALWVAASHAQPAWEHATRLVIKSPVKRCGKSRLLDLAEALCHRPLPTVNVSVAALVRSINEDDPPTLLLDEADAIFGKRRGERAEAAEDLRGILNAGHKRGGKYLRWDQARRQPEECPTFSMAALAGIGDLPDTIEDRAVIVTMRRRAPGEQVSSFRRRRDLPALVALRDRLHGWLRDHLAELETATPAMPVEDRAADTWEPLVAVADLAGGGWPELAREACRRMTADAAEADDGTLGERLLRDLREVFADAQKLWTTTIIERLAELDEAPWGDYYGQRVTDRAIAKLLRPYGVRSHTVRVGAETRKGYHREDLADAWQRYSTPAGTSDTSDTLQVSPVPDCDAPAASGTKGNMLTREVTDVTDVTGTPPARVPEHVADDGTLWCDQPLPGIDPGDPRRFTRS